LPSLFSVSSKKVKEATSVISELSVSSNIPCPELTSKQIKMYINRTPVTYGGACRRELIEKEMFPDKFSCEICFDSKKLSKDEIIEFNKKIASESE
jgi:hypothetical protein